MGTPADRPGCRRCCPTSVDTGRQYPACRLTARRAAAWHLAESRAGRWLLVAGTSLHLLAEQFGCVDTVRALVHRHRADRARYRRALRIVDQHHTPAPNPSEGYRWPPPEPPPDEGETLLELLERELGAHPISVGA